MEDIKTTKVNNAAADLPEVPEVPEVPRDPEGNILIDQVSTGRDNKNNYIVPDDILEAYYKELPEGTTNVSNDKWVYKKGILKKATKEIQRMGAESLNAKLSQRKSNKEILEDIARKNTPIEELERLGLEASSENNMLVAANYAAVLKAIRGDIKALEYIRDTLGEKPVTEVNATIEEITPEDKELLERVNARLNRNT